MVGRWSFPFGMASWQVLGPRLVSGRVIFFVNELSMSCWIILTSCDARPLKSSLRMKALPDNSGTSRLVQVDLYRFIILSDVVLVLSFWRRLLQFLSSYYSIYSFYFILLCSLQLGKRWPTPWSIHYIHWSMVEVGCVGWDFDQPWLLYTFSMPIHLKKQIDFLMMMMMMMVMMMVMMMMLNRNKITRGYQRDVLNLSVGQRFECHVWGLTVRCKSVNLRQFFIQEWTFRSGYEMFDSLL